MNKEIALARITCQSRFEEVVNLINSLYSNRIIEYIYSHRRFYKPSGAYKLCCTPQKYVDNNWPELKTFLSFDPVNKSITIALPLKGAAVTKELYVSYDNNQLTLEYIWNCNTNTYEGSFAMTFYD